MNIVITGAGRGIGLALVKEFLKDSSVTNVIACSRNLNNLKDTAAADHRLRLYQMDLTKPESIDLIRPFLEEYSVKAIRILINNAGHLINDNSAEQSFGQIMESYQANVIGPHYLINVLKPYLVGGGHIVNIGSMGGVNMTSKFPGLSSYSAPKGALGILSEQLAEEFLTEDISVNCLALGTVQTEMMSAAFPGFQAQQSPESIAGFIKWFAIHGHNWFNGKVIPVSKVGK
jgi:3-oxoacyl-[acyl-carrier protein] reductase